MISFQKIFGLGLIFTIFILLGLFSPLLLPKVHSQNPNCISSILYPRYNNGILTTPNLQSSGKFGNTSGQCVIDPVKAGIVSFKIPTYDQLKNTYFERKVSTIGANAIDKVTKTGDQTSLLLNTGGATNRLWNITGKLTLPDQASLIVANDLKAVIFIDGNLEIGDLNATANDPGSRTAQNFTYGNSGSGVVFIVKGSVNFGRNVHRFDGIIIAQGTICTSMNFGNQCLQDAHSDSDPGGETKQLIINGNLISLDPTKPIKFQRNLIFSTVTFPLGNDTTPAEIINVQPKYLVIMKDLFSNIFTIQTEDTHYALNQ